MLDISKEPMEVAPTAHYSMGGIVVPQKNTKQILKVFLLVVKLLILHGANRLGGNSLAEILIFGKRAENLLFLSLNLKSNQDLLRK